MNASPMHLGMTLLPDKQAFMSNSALLDKRKPKSELGSAEIDENYLGMPVKKFSEATKAKSNDSAHRASTGFGNFRM